MRLRAALCMAAAFAAHPEHALADVLAPYRQLAVDGRGVALLAVARAALLEAAGAEPPARVSHAFPDTSPDWPAPPRPVYLSLVRGHATRACVGADGPLGGTLAETVRSLAIRARSADRRRAPVRADELAELRIVLAFAGDAVAADPQTVKPSREGWKLETARGAIAFLPGEARTIHWALGEARRAGVLTGPVADAVCTRFPVVLLSEPARPFAREDRSE